MVVVGVINRIVLEENMKFQTLKILKEETSRSENAWERMPDDMIKIVLTCSTNDWFWIKKLLRLEKDEKRK